MAKINFFKKRQPTKPPTTPQNKIKSTITTYVCKPSWIAVKQQVFSDTSNSDLSSNSSEVSNSFDDHGLWMAAANPDNHPHHPPHHPNNEDTGELWADAANPADYESASSCDLTTTINNNNTTNTINNTCNRLTINNNNTNITTDVDIDDDSIIFNPPEILGHHQSLNKHTADPNATILE